MSKPDPPAKLSHVTSAGDVQMVDVSTKSVTARTASASATVDLGEQAFAQLENATLAKGDALTTAKIAGIQAAKRTSELIPLCHGLAPEQVDVEITLEPPRTARIRATVRLAAKTGVEMEALVAVSVAALTLYDMCKAVSKSITIGPIQLESKTGGKSRDYRRSE